MGIKYQVSSVCVCARVNALVVEWRTYLNIDDNTSYVFHVGGWHEVLRICMTVGEKDNIGSMDSFPLLGIMVSASWYHGASLSCEVGGCRGFVPSHKKSD